MRRSARGHIGFWVGFAVVVIRPMVSVLFRVRWRGREHVPAAGGVIMVANHISHADWLTFARYVWDCRRVPRFLAKESLFRLPGIGSVLRGARQIPVRRGTAAARESLDRAVEALARGECVCIYPEGTVTRDPEFWPMVPRTGVARLALGTGAPVVPVAQWGPQLLLDVHGRRFRPFARPELVAVAGPPVDLSGYRGRPVTAELLREVSDVIMVEVRDLLGGIRGETPPDHFYRRPPAREAS
ncbi:MAG: Acyl-CoA:1-acyl-sn-glycerol-3-phosphate acyltransferase [uncultured Corynebacteriales bacterium]|uniref:Acyl-CoA:1-acyl-sn-glycerol-3-phosphate acyltransferase n=1 Tax=uncultured Mycobacteriales bacterium TaxID=581187 RepID=A0A6J4IF55_9ACTN|nr:MAG: Acyl-CoA:1-acyl-sn-glycerol-3-phosphate acyltransferase [uncultured Corynebacteriales bacterium]